MTRDDVRSILIQAHRYWYAGGQDKDPVVRYMHLSYAKNGLDTVIFLATREEINSIIQEAPERFADVRDFDDFYKKVALKQDQAGRLLVEVVTR